MSPDWTALVVDAGKGNRYTVDQTAPGVFYITRRSDGMVIEAWTSPTPPNDPTLIRISTASGHRLGEYRSGDADIVRSVLDIDQTGRVVHRGPPSA